MRVLLVNSNRFWHPWPVIPFGLCCIATSIERAGYSVKVLDLCFSNNPASDIQQNISAWNPDVVGVSIRNIDNSAGYNTLFLLDRTRDEIIAPLKKYFTGPIVIGGPAVGINGAEMLEFFNLPYAIRGDGEITVVEFMKRLEQGLSLKGLGGLVIRENGKVVQDAPPLLVDPLDNLPFVNPSKYLDLNPYKKFGSPLQIQTKRGCALHCSYCTYNRIEGRRYRLRSPERVADEIKTLIAETGMDHVELTDSTFNIPLRHAKDVLRALIKKNLKLRLRTMGLNPGAVDEELVDLMQQAGFIDVDLGVDSGSDAMLKSLGKNFTKSEILRAGDLLRKKNIPVTWYLLVGGHGETQETLYETFDTLDRAASRWDLVNFGVGVRVYDGSPLADKMRSNNEQCCRDNFLHPVHIEPEALSLESVKLITKKAALSRTNYFMYDEDETTPAFIMVIGTFLLRLFAPRQPIWRLFILMRLAQKYTGVAFLRKLIFEWRNRASLSKLHTTDEA
jgi:radical SAM superfamily enzyme YgiQ (UPF0313 family)